MPAAIVPELPLLIPPEKVETLLMLTPVLTAEIVPELLMPPEIAALPFAQIPLLLALIVPALLMVPPMLPPVTRMPVRIGAAPPVAVMMPVPVLVTPPVTVMPEMSMQLIEAELLTELWLVTGWMAQLPASARGVPAATSSAATELVASNKCNRGPLAPGASRIHPPRRRRACRRADRPTRSRLPRPRDFLPIRLISA